MESIKVSILVVTYNQEAYIAACLDSLLVQKTGFKYEILVGDDASQDGTAKIVQRYAEMYPDMIVPVLRKKNIGATNNSYELWRLARGQYIAFCDGDDCWLGKNRLQEQTDFLDSHPNFSAVCGRSRLIDEHGNEIPESSLHTKQVFWKFNRSVYTRDDFSRWRMPCHDSAILGHNPWNEQDPSLLYMAHPIVGDRTFVMYFLLRGDIACQEEEVSCYRYVLKGEHFMTDYAKENRRYQDFLLMCRLEKYANRHRWPLSLLKWKQERLIAAACVWLKKPNMKNWHVLYSIVKDSGNRRHYVLWTLKILVRKWWQWHVSGKDIPIRL